jgi:phytol kinase
MAGASVIVLLVLSSVAPGPAPGSVLVIAAAATVLEQVSVMGVDNLSVPMVVGWLWTTLR